MAYKIENHWLVGVAESQVGRQESPNQGGEITPEYLVIHCTAGRSAKSSIGWLTSPEAKASAHLVIGRDGSVTQLVAFNRRAWHAGASQWAGRPNVNNFSIGIELDNMGKLHQVGDAWMSWFGGTVPNTDVVKATHKDESVPAGWQLFSAVQLDAALAVGAVLARAYSLKDVVGHDDVAPGRKNDPGPAFPMEMYRNCVLGRDGDTLSVYCATDILNLRGEPSSIGPKLVAAGLPPGTRMIPLGPQKGAWWLVLILDPIGGDRDLEGWVHSHYLTREAHPGQVPACPPSGARLQRQDGLGVLA